MKTASKSLPGAWVDRLFARFVALYGSAKVAAMWANADVVEIKAVWSEELGRFDPEMLLLAMQVIVDSGREWPPTLPEFVAACQQVRRSPTPAPADGGLCTSKEEGQRKCAELAKMLVDRAIKRMPGVAP